MRRFCCPVILPSEHRKHKDNKTHRQRKTIIHSVNTHNGTLYMLVSSCSFQCVVIHCCTFFRSALFLFFCCVVLCHSIFVCLFWLCQFSWLLCCCLILPLVACRGVCLLAMRFELKQKAGGLYVSPSISRYE